MKKRRILSLIATAVTSLLLIVGLRLVNPSPVLAQSSSSMLISAAASLKDAMTEIKPLYEQKQSGVTINYNFGASGALQQQIEQGAPVDVFISAGKKQMDALEQKGLLVPGTRTNLANNRLVLIVPNNSTVGINSFNTLTDSKVKRIAVGEPRSVPAGQYADQVLKQLNIYDQVKSKLVFANNVRQVLAAVESGNADAGLVYASDAKISNKVKVAVVADEKSHSPIVYPMAVLKRSKNIDAAKAFVQFLSGEPTQSILQKYGFLVKSPVGSR
ncbi:MAG: molybdate ABC transporter substrate-binding protein [Rhizonema sp. NSF051]|nr:molybdate ABC transporter substrate-binding protein [Rhizonema sp. NSF051]